MGLLDPKINKGRTFELLEKKGAVKAELVFEGGHDEGGVNRITLTLKDGSEVDLAAWYCGGYSYTGDDWAPLSTPANEDEELADLLEGPINEKFGAWGGQESTVGLLTWDVNAGNYKLVYEQDEPRYHELEG